MSRLTLKALEERIAALEAQLAVTKPVVAPKPSTWVGPVVKPREPDAKRYPRMHAAWVAHCASL